MPPTPPLLAGFDAGQTHTRCRLALHHADGSLQGLATGDGSGVSHLAAPGGEERFQTALTSALAAALGAAGLPASTGLAAAAIGASGIERGTERQMQAQALAATALGMPAARLLVSGDEHTALRGAFEDGCGLLLICGTGTIAVGRNASGQEARCAGWGWMLDGAGSTFDIGRDGLAASLRMADGREAEGPLRQRLWRELGLEPGDPQAPQRIKALVVQPGFSPAGLAALAPAVEALAREGDPQATAILARHADALVAMAVTLSRQLALSAPVVCGVGGGLEHLQTLRRSFQAGLGRALPQAVLRTPAADACQGALLLAADLRRR